MRVKVDATTIWRDNGDKLLETYPFLKKPEYRMTSTRRGKEPYCSHDHVEVYVEINDIDTLQNLVHDIKEIGGVGDGETIISVDDNGQWQIEIYDGWRE